MSDFVDIDSLYDIARSDELIVKFGKYIDHNNLQDCKRMLKSVNETPNSVRRKTQRFFFSMEPPSSC
jgi:hypothetical protein